MKAQQTIIPCPNCGKETVEARHKAGYLGHTVSGFGKKTYKFHQVPEKYEILSGCKECGKTAEELIKIEKEGKPVDHEARLKKWQESGLPSVITSSPKIKKRDGGLS